MADTPKVTEHLDRDPNDPRARDYTPNPVSDLNDPVQGGAVNNPKADDFQEEPKPTLPETDDKTGK